MLLHFNTRAGKGTIFYWFKWHRQSSETFRMDLQVLLFFTFMWPCCILTNFFIIKPTICTKFTNLFCHETLHVSDSSSVHHQQFIHCTLSNGICHTAFEQEQDGTAVPSWSCSKAVYKPVWRIPMLSVQWINSWWCTDELSETYRVSCQNKLVNFMYLVGFIIKKKGPQSVYHS